MSRTDSRATIRELKRALEIIQQNTNSNAERDRKNWGETRWMRRAKARRRRRFRHDDRRAVEQDREAG